MRKHNCLGCQRYIACRDPQKSRNFLCSDYREKVLDDSVLFGRPAAVMETGDDSALLALAMERQREEEMARKELDLEGIVDEILKSESVVPKDFKIDDSDLPDFKNIYDYIYNESYSFGMPLWTRQIWMGIKLFADWCPRCSHPCMRETIPHPEYDPVPHQIPVGMDGKEILDWVQLLEHGVCPKCKAGRSELVMSGELAFYNELAAVIGQRSGKSTITAIFDSYLVARLLKLQKPTQVYPGVARNTTLMGTMVALRFQDANDLLWQPYKDTIAGSVWYQEYHKLMKHYNNKYGQELFKELDTYIKYGHRNLHIYPSGPNKRTLRGRTRIFANIDEYGWFDSKAESDDKERTSAREVYGALDVSLETIRASANLLLQRGYNNIPTAYAMNISSPSSEDDAIMELVKANKTSNKIFAVHLPTWSVNPILTREVLQSAFDKDYASAMRNLGVIPPESANPYFAPSDPLQEAFGKFENGVTYKPIIGYDSQNRRKCAIEILTCGSSMQPHVMAIDAGQTKNSFSLTLGTLDHKAPLGLGRIRFPVMVECQPQKDAAISFAQMKKQVIKKLIEAYNVVGVFADRWQSTLLLDELSEEYKDRVVGGKPCPLYTQVYSVKYRDFMDFKSYVTDGGIWFPYIEVENPHMVDMSTYPYCFEGAPAHHMFFQCRRSVDRGIVVEKGPKVTDDLLRASVLATHWLLDEKWSAQYLQPVTQQGGGRARGGVVGRSGGLLRGGGAGNRSSRVRVVSRGG